MTTSLMEFQAGRGPTEMYETFWVPCTLWPHAISLVEHVQPGDQVLDVGAGTGLLAELASARVGASGHVTALEPTPFMLDLLHEKYDGSTRIDVVGKSIEEATFPDGTFDTLLCHQVVQYIADLPAAFEQMHRVLKPRGKLVIGVWSGPEDQDASALEPGFRVHLGEEFAPIHAWSFGGLGRLKKLAEAAGFNVEVLETQARPSNFRSVEELLNVHIAGGMRFIDGDIHMGIFDLDDQSFVPKVEALYADLHKQLGQYEGQSRLEISFASDVLIARA